MVNMTSVRAKNRSGTIKEGKYSAGDVAKYFIDLSKEATIDEGVAEGITNLKLQKMLYFAQAAHLALYDSKLFNEDIKAWKYGPVVEPVYRTYRGYKNKPIPFEKGSREAIPDPETQEFLKGIWELFDKYSAVELMHIAHKHKPWKDVYRENEDVTITPAAMRDYYKGVFRFQDEKANA